MQTRNLTGTVALGSLTAAVALLAGLSNASAQTAPGGGSFPQSFLIPGTNTSLSLYGVIKMSATQQFGSQHTGDTNASGAMPFQLGQLALEGPGATAGTSAARTEYAMHGGLRAQVKSTTFTFETRTPTDLGELKTVMSMDFSLFANQANYVGTSTSNNKPSPGAGNSEAPRILWAYGTIGPWLIGQTNTAWADPLLSPSDVGDPNQMGFVTTSNVRQPQIRYTYLAGNGITLSGSLEAHPDGAKYLTPNSSTVATTATIMTSAAIGSFTSDNTDTGGVTNLPSFNTGIAWDQPWGHLMARAGVAQVEIRNATSGTQIMGTTCAPATATCTNTGTNNLTKWGWAAETGFALNTWGQDQWKGLVNYTVGTGNWDSDLGSAGGEAFINGYTGQFSLTKELAIETSYTHRFNPNWRMTAEVGVGFYNKPSSAAGLTNTCGTGPATCNNTAAQLASIEKRHLASHLVGVWAPLPGLFEITAAWTHWERTVQASSTWGQSNSYSLQAAFYW